MQAAQNWTDTAQGTALMFTTTPINSTTPATRMTLDATGQPRHRHDHRPAAGSSSKSATPRTTPPSGTSSPAAHLPTAGGSLFVGSKARGTSAAPTAVQNGDNLVGFLGRGYRDHRISAAPAAACSCGRPRTGRTRRRAPLDFNTTATGTITPSHEDDHRLRSATSASARRIRSRHWKLSGTVRPISSARPITMATGAPSSSSAPAERRRRQARFRQATPLATLARPGYGATTWGNGAGAIAVVAAENWTDTANGNAIGFRDDAAG